MFGYRPAWSGADRRSGRRWRAAGSMERGHPIRPEREDDRSMAVDPILQRSGVILEKRVQLLDRLDPRPPVHARDARVQLKARRARVGKRVRTLFQDRRDPEETLLLPPKRLANRTLSLQDRRGFFSKRQARSFVAGCGGTPLRKDRAGRFRRFGARRFSFARRASARRKIGLPEPARTPVEQRASSTRLSRRRNR